MNQILNRETIAKDIKQILSDEEPQNQYEDLVKIYRQNIIVALQKLNNPLWSASLVTY